MGDYIHEKVTVADQVLVPLAVAKVSDGDVILTYAYSQVQGGGGACGVEGLGGPIPTSGTGGGRGGEGAGARGGGGEGGRRAHRLMHPKWCQGQGWMGAHAVNTTTAAHTAANCRPLPPSIQTFLRALAPSHHCWCCPRWCCGCCWRRRQPGGGSGWWWWTAGLSWRGARCCAACCRWGVGRGGGGAVQGGVREGLGMNGMAEQLPCCAVAEPGGAR